MREERVIALAGLFQAIALVRSIATRGGADVASVQPSIASVFMIDAPAPAAVFGGLPSLDLGLKTLITQLDDGAHDLAFTRLLVSVLRVERKLASRPAMLQTLREGIQSIGQQTTGIESSNPAVAHRIAQLYTETISKLRPRILVEGNPQFLKQDVQVAQIRALLLAAIRAAVLWRQLGGSRWSLLFRRRQYAMLARGLLARSTLGGT